CTVPPSPKRPGAPSWCMRSPSPTPRTGWWPQASLPSTPPGSTSSRSRTERCDGGFPDQTERARTAIAVRALCRFLFGPPARLRGPTGSERSAAELVEGELGVALRRPVHRPLGAKEQQLVALVVLHQFHVGAQDQ